MALLLVLVLAVAVASSYSEETTIAPVTTEKVQETTPAVDEASKNKRTVEQQLGYGHNDIQPRYNRQQQRRVPQPQRGSFYVQPDYQQDLSKPQQSYIPAPALYNEGEVPQSYQQQGFPSHPAFNSPHIPGPRQLLGSPLLLPGTQLVPVIVLRLHDTGSGPQVAQAFPALLHSPAPPRATPGYALQALQSLLRYQPESLPQYQPESLPQYQPDSLPQYQPEPVPQYQPAADKVVYIAPKTVFGSKKPASPLLAKTRKPAPSPSPGADTQFTSYKDKSQ